MPKRKIEGVYERPGSRFWWTEYRDRGGQPTRRSTGIPIAEDPQGLKARALRAQWQADDARERQQVQSSFDDLLLLYLEQVTPTKRAPERDRFSAKALFPAFTGRALSDIGAQEVRGYIQSRRQAGIAPATINREIGLMSAALNWARKELEWDVSNPWESRRQTEPDGRDRWLTQTEAEALLRAADRTRAPYLADFVRLGLYAGLRPGEILGLEWGRVDMARDQIRFSASDQKSGKAGTVPINQFARVALLNRRRFADAHCPASTWVFCRDDGSRIASVKKGFAKAVQDAGLTNVHPHDLRRTCGSWLVQAGVGIERVSRILRHSDVSVTARVYAHLRPSDLADALSVLDGNAQLCVLQDPVKNVSA